MAALAATSLNGVRIYNLASGKTFPQWLSEKTKRSLAKDEGILLSFFDVVFILL